VRDDHDRLLGARDVGGHCGGRGRDQVDEVLRSQAGHIRTELLPLDGEIVVAEARGDPVRRLGRAGRSRAAIRIVAGQLGRELHRCRAVERWRQTWLLQGDRLADAECGDEERDGDDEPCGPVDTAGDRPLEGSAPGSPAFWGDGHGARASLVLAAAAYPL
jgi:hypothetical protein